tara:strand:+ start:253 stop:780 length:528 start_codon:yes stop_codon:yes gene_type:complete
MAQVIRITSEALQATIRRLLPSQQGFGEDLQASNVILPVIDVTPTAEGSQLPQSLQSAFSAGGATNYSAGGSTVTIANTPGFYRVYVTSTISASSSAAASNEINVVNSSGTKNIFKTAGYFDQNAVNYVELTVFLDTGDTLQASSSGSLGTIQGSVIQIADRYGNLNNPAGFTFE